MESTAVMAEKLSPQTNKRKNLIIAVASGLVIFVAFVIVLLTSAHKLPAILDEDFSSANAAKSFDTSGSGTWTVANGVYQLAQPASLDSSADGNVSLSVNQKKFTSDEWRMDSDAKVADTSKPHDFSMVFDYTDQYNYFYANFSDAADAHSNGIFKVANGKVSQLTKFSATIKTGQNYSVEIRKKGDQAKVYLNKTYLAKADTKASSNVQVGYGSRGGSVTFDNLMVSGDGGTPTSSSPDPTPTPTPTPPPSTPPTGNDPTPTRNGHAVSVSNTEQLTAALADAQPGDVITMADGVYSGKLQPVNVGGRTTNAKFRITKSGTADKPIVLQGSGKAIIDGKPGGKGTGGDYGLHLIGASHWEIKGIRVTNVGKGIVLDQNSNNNVIDSVTVDTIGDEAVHFRSGSSYNVIKDSFITSTGHSNEGYGEALYIGTDSGSWDLLMGKGGVDRASHNQILNNKITAFTAEGIDIKEASSYNVISGNYFDGSAISGKNSSDSWVDVKGDHNTFTGNSGVNVLMFLKSSSAAFQTHVHGPSGYDSANDNVFSKNSINLNGPGYGFWIDPHSSNTVTCDNTVTNAGHGFGNVACKQ